MYENKLFAIVSDSVSGAFVWVAVGIGIRSRHILKSRVLRKLCK